VTVLIAILIFVLPPFFPAIDMYLFGKPSCGDWICGESIKYLVYAGYSFIISIILFVLSFLGSKNNNFLVVHQQENAPSINRAIKYTFFAFIFFAIIVPTITSYLVPWDYAYKYSMSLPGYNGRTLNDVMQDREKVINDNNSKWPMKSVITNQGTIININEINFIMKIDGLEQPYNKMMVLYGKAKVTGTQSDECKSLARVSGLNFKVGDRVEVKGSVYDNYPTQIFAVAIDTCIQKEYYIKKI
jgi:hypothetical protein